jgi:hypothetical protein
MTKKGCSPIPASFCFSDDGNWQRKKQRDCRYNQETLTEAYTLAMELGDPSAAPAIHYAIAALLPAARYMLMAYPCDYKAHFETDPQCQKRQEKVNINEHAREKRAIAEWATRQRATIERIHKNLFPDFYYRGQPTRMDEEARLAAIRQFQQQMEQHHARTQT